MNDGNKNTISGIFQDYKVLGCAIATFDDQRDMQITFPGASELHCQLLKTLQPRWQRNC
jgi:hypothetical protein